MTLQFDKQGKIGLIRLTGPIDASNVMDLKKKFQEWMNETSYFVMDLNQVDFIDSTGLGGLVACLKYASEAGGDLKIACLQPKPRMVFEITRAFKIFEVYDDVNVAIASYK